MLTCTFWIRINVSEQLAVSPLTCYERIHESRITNGISPHLPHVAKVPWAGAKILNFEVDFIGQLCSHLGQN